MMGYISTPKGQNIAYDKIQGPKGPSILFLPGFRSSRQGAKAMALQEYCLKSQRTIVRFDYSGHWESSGVGFECCCLSDWILDSGLTILDQVCKGEKVVLVGASMGAWIAVHMALQRPDQVEGIVGIGAAPDFTEDLLTTMTEEQKEQLERTGVYLRPSAYSNDDYPITKALLEDGRKWTLLGKAEGRIPLGDNIKVHLLHGMKDVDVSWRKSLELAEKLQTERVTVTLIKDGDHRLSRRSDLERIIQAVDDLLTAIAAVD